MMAINFFVQGFECIRSISSGCIQDDGNDANVRMYS